MTTLVMYLALVVASYHACGVDALPSGFQHRDTIKAASPTPPVFPDSYKMRYTFLLPYVTTVQSEPFRMPVDVWYNGPARMLRIDVYDGLDSTYMTPAATYTVFPRLREYACSVTNNTVGPTIGQGAAGAAGLGSEASFAAPLPDLSDWTYAGVSHVRGEDANIWQSGLRVDDKVNTYTFFTSRAGHPLKLHMMGLNLLTGSHYDEYLVEFDSFTSEPLDSAFFTPPEVCQHPIDPNAGDGPNLRVDTAGRLAAQAISMLPSANIGKTSPRAAPSPSNMLQLPEHHVLRANLDFVRTWNDHQSEDAGYTLAANKFSSWTDDRFKATMLGTVSPYAASADAATAKQEAAASSSQSSNARPLLGRPGHGVRQQDVVVKHGAGWLGEYQRVLTDKQLPKSVDWRGTPADGPVKDQASCGSCWAFAAVGALQAAWYNATGVAMSLSEQQLVDCSWKHRNGGCGGGYPMKAIEYLAQEHTSIWPEEAYPYVGANDFCKALSDDPSSSEAASTRNRIGKARSSLSKARRAPVDTARFTGYKTIKSGDEKAVMEALALHGPLAVSMNAAHPTFKFYSEGVYFRKDCGNTPDFMDHAVVLSGYGTDAKSGKDFWIIRNSWSTFWGSDGYAKIARKENDCGVSLEAVMAVADTTPPST